MNVLLDISLYPLTDHYSKEVQSFVAALAASGLECETTQVSTIIRGDYDAMMPIVTRIMRNTLSEAGRKAIVLKIMNMDDHSEY